MWGRRRSLINFTKHQRSAGDFRVAVRISRIALNTRLENGMARSSAETGVTPAAQLESFIARFDATQQKLIRAVHAAMRKRLPTANEFAYDYGTHIVIAYSPTDKSTDGIFATDWREDGVRLYFTHGITLADPKKLLEGSATQVRYISVESAKRIVHPDVEELIVATITRSKVPLPATGGGMLVIKPTTASKRAATTPAKKAAGTTPAAKRAK